jgi:hypothetical protein
MGTGSGVRAEDWADVPLRRSLGAACGNGSSINGDDDGSARDGVLLGRTRDERFGSELFRVVHFCAGALLILELGVWSEKRFRARVDGSQIEPKESER